MKKKQLMALLLSATLAVSGMGITGLGAVEAMAATEAEVSMKDGDILVDLTFDSSDEGFMSYTNGGECEISNSNKQLAIHITKTGTLDYANQAYYDGFGLVEGVKYKLSFDAMSDKACSMEYRIQLNGGDYHAYVGEVTALTDKMTHVEKEFVMEEATDPAPRLAFNMGMQKDMKEDPGEHTITIDSIRLEVVDCSGAKGEGSDAEKSISVNHVGYRPADKKVAVASGDFAGKKFEVRDKKGKVAFSGTFGDAKEDKATESAICRGGFTKLKKKGTYTIVVDHDGEEVVSETFSIGENVYDKLSESVFNMLPLQRCGEEVSEEAAGEFAHPACHTGKALVYDSDIEKDVTGGWHDAGDYGRYIVSGAQTVADLMYIIEKGDKDQKYLNEVKYELEWMLKMQDENGGVYHKVTCANFPDTVMPEKETEQLILSPVSIAATGDFAAVMAKAAEDYMESDADFAATCGKAAVAAWEYLQANPDQKGFTNPKEIVTGEYPDEQLDDEVCWAAVELLDQIDKGNIEADIREDLIATISDKMEKGIGCGLGWADMGGFALYDLARLESEEAEVQKMAETAKEKILSEAKGLKKLIKEDGYYASMGTNYYWGSNMGVANNALMLLMAEELSEDEKYMTAAKQQLDYLLGVNGLDFCYVSGVGEKCLTDPHHRPSQVAGKAVPGMLAGGPNPNLEDPYAQQVLSGKAPALCYADNQQSYSTNEVAIYWNSPLIAVLDGIK